MNLVATIHNSHTLRKSASFWHRVFCLVIQSSFRSATLCIAYWQVLQCCS